MVTEWVDTVVPDEGLLAGAELSRRQHGYRMSLLVII